MGATRKGRRVQKPMTWRRFLVPSQWRTWSLILKRVGGAEGGTIAAVALR